MTAIQAGLLRGPEKVAISGMPTSNAVESVEISLSAVLQGAAYSTGFSMLTRFRPLIRIFHSPSSIPVVWCVFESA